MRRKRLASVSVSIVVLWSAAVVWAQGLPAAPPESVGMSAQRLGRISEALKQEVAQGKLPGAVVIEKVPDTYCGVSG